MGARQIRRRIEIHSREDCALFKGRGQAADWVAHASRVLVSASSLKRSFLVISIRREVRDGETPSLRQLPDETRALLRVARVEIIGKLQFHFHEDNTRSSTRRLRLCAAV